MRLMSSGVAVSRPGVPTQVVVFTESESGSDIIPTAMEGQKGEKISIDTCQLSYLLPMLAFTLSVLIKFTTAPLVLFFLVLLARKTLFGTSTDSLSSQPSDQLPPAGDSINRDEQGAQDF